MDYTSTVKELNTCVRLYNVLTNEHSTVCIRSLTSQDLIKKQLDMILTQMLG